MAAEPDPQQLLTALTTEHFTLQGARSQTVSESSARASLYLFSVSSTLVALEFIGSALNGRRHLQGLRTHRLAYHLRARALHLRAPRAERRRGLPVRAGDKPDQAPLSRARGRPSPPVHDVGSRRRDRGARQHGNQALRPAGLLHHSEHGRSDQQRRRRQRDRDCDRGDWGSAARGSRDHRGLVAIVSLAALRRFETRYLRAGVGELKILFPSPPQPLGIMSDPKSAAPPGLAP